MEFGLYAWQPDGSVDRKLKEGAKTLVRLTAHTGGTVLSSIGVLRMPIVLKIWWRSVQQF